MSVETDPHVDEGVSGLGVQPGAPEFRLGDVYIFEHEALVATVDGRFIQFHNGTSFEVMSIVPGEAEGDGEVGIKCSFNPAYVYRVKNRSLWRYFWANHGD